MRLSAKKAATYLLQRLCLVCRPLFDSPTIVTRCCASISLATLSPFLPPTRPHASSSSLFWHWTDLQPEDSERGTEDWRKPRGNMKVRSWRKQEEGSMFGRGGQEKENARQWSNDLAVPAIIKGMKGGVQRHKERVREKEWVLINMALRRFALPLFLSPTLYHFLHQLPIH